MGAIMNPAYEAGRIAAERVGAGLKRGRDENTIETILSQAMSANDPAVLQKSIGTILSQVSPERQGQALQYLQNSYNTLKEKQDLDRKRQAVSREGVNPDLPENLQKVQFENKILDNRANSIIKGVPSGQVKVPDGNESTIQSQGVDGIDWGKLSDAQLVALSGVKGFSEPSKQELKRRQEDRKLDQKKDSAVFQAELGRSNKVLERADEIAEQIPQKRTALNLMKDAVANRDLSYFSGDNLAEITGQEFFRSPEGAIFKTAGKEYFLGNIARAGARPNQWIEQQIADMMAKIGRSPEANFSVLRALENELDLDEERVRATNEISDELSAKGDFAQGKLGYLLNQRLKNYAEEKQKVLYNDLRAIKAVAENKPQKFMKVPSGTNISPYMVEALLAAFNNDDVKASEEAKKLGYTVE